MNKQTFTNEFKQGVVKYVLDHPDAVSYTHLSTLYARFKC